jgi:hypothetical protein
MVRDAVKQAKKKLLAKTPYASVYSHLKLINELLYFGDRLLVPQNKRMSEIKAHHEQYGHESAYKLIKRLVPKFFWPNMRSDICRFVAHCDLCQRTKYRTPNIAKVGHIVDVNRAEAAKPFYLVSIDFKGPFRCSDRGNRYIIVAVDYFSKWVEAKPTPDCTAATTAQFILENIIFRHGAPTHILSDQAQNFESKIVADLCSRYKIAKLRSSPYHAMGDGAVEREIRSISESLRPSTPTISSQATWDEHIAAIIHTRNTTVHDSTRLTPFEMVYARPFFANERPPVDFGSSQPAEFSAMVKQTREAIEQRARSNILKAQTKMDKATAKRTKKSPSFMVDDLVLVANEATHPNSSKKLEPLFLGPFRVTKLKPPSNAILQIGNQLKNVHFNRLRKYRSSEPALIEPASSERSPSESTSTESLLVESTVSDNRPVEPVSSERRDIASVAIEGVGELAPTATTPLNPAPAPRVSAFGRPLRAPVRFVAAHRVALRTNSC